MHRSSPNPGDPASKVDPLAVLAAWSDVVRDMTDDATMLRAALARAVVLAREVSGARRAVFVTGEAHLITLAGSDAAARGGDGVLLIEGPEARAFAFAVDCPGPVRQDGYFVYPHGASALVLGGVPHEFVRDAFGNHVAQIIAATVSHALDATLKVAELTEQKASLEEARRKLSEQNVLLTELAVVDELTKLHNRRYFDRRLSYEMERARRYRRPLTVVIADIDKFKSVNDTRGHDVGDVVLKCVSKEMEATVRKTDLVARYGGEEFAILLPETTPEGATLAAERLRVAVESAACPVDPPLAVTSSFGVATAIDGWSGDAQSFLRAADKALYEAKRTGRNRFIAVTLSDNEDGRP